MKEYKDSIIHSWIANYKNNIPLFSSENVKPLTFLYRTKYYFNSPVVICNSGPSLDKQLSLLQEWKNKVVIISCDSCAFKLIENNIDPDLIVVTDPSPIVSKFFSNIDTSKYTLVFPTTGATQVLADWKGNCFLYNPIDRVNTEKGEALSKLIRSTEGFGSLPNRLTVTSTCCQVSSLFSPCAVMTIGLDLSFTLSKPYFQGYVENYIKQGDSRSEETITQVLTSDAVQVEGDLYTRPVFKIYKEIITHVLLNELCLNSFNCTEGGILDTIPNVPFKEALEKYCKDEITKIDLFQLPKRKRSK